MADLSGCGWPLDSLPVLTGKGRRMDSIAASRPLHQLYLLLRALVPRHSHGPLPNFTPLFEYLSWEVFDTYLDLGIVSLLPLIAHPFSLVCFPSLPYQFLIHWFCLLIWLIICLSIWMCKLYEDGCCLFIFLLCQPGQPSVSRMVPGTM